MVDEYLVGSKETFAFEIKSEDIVSNYGNVVVWVESRYIGNFEESQILGTVWFQLKRLIESTDLGIVDKLQGLNPARQLCVLEEEESGQYMCSFGESFDQFSVYAYRDLNSLKLVWRLEDSDTFPDSNYSIEVKTGSVLIADVLTVISDVKKL